MSNYHFITRWQVPTSCEEVYRILEAPENLPIWWPSVYLDVNILEKGQSGGIGKLVELHTKGWLPYTLRWRFRVTKTDFPNGFELEALGDFVGRGIWTFKPLPNSHCEVIYDWKISAEKPLLKTLTPLLRPIFSANHHWAMHKGEESLKLEILRRSAQTPEELAIIPLPPPPSFTKKANFH